VETGKCACGATATIQHIITECQLNDKQDITDDAQKESKKHIEQSFMPEEVKEVMKHMNEYTWESTEVEKEGIEHRTRTTSMERDTDTNSKSPSSTVDRSDEQRT
jgi:hypothetical protein